MSGTSISPSADPIRTSPRHVLLWGTFDTGKPRIRILRDAIEASGAKLEQVHANVWGAVEDKSQIRGLLAPLTIFWRMLLAYPTLLWRLCKAPRPDIILVSYPGLLDAVLAAVIGRWRAIPVCLDVFISIYDTVVLDRGLLRPASLAARALFLIERFCLDRAQVLFMDTATHARRMEALFGYPRFRMSHVWVGAEADRFPAEPSNPRIPGSPLKVLFYGQFIPLHGIATIVNAARLLQDSEVDWVIIGKGQESQRVDAMLDAVPLPRVKRLPWVDYRQLIDHMRDADVCLGIFGTSDKAASVIPNKIYQIIAGARPFITRDSEAIRELITPAPDAVLVPAGDPQALARSILAMTEQDFTPCPHRTLRDAITPARIAEQFNAMLDAYLERAR